jgi:hypothetical protein
MHRSNLLIHSLTESRFQTIRADLHPNFSDSRKKFICKRELLSLEAVFAMPNQNTRKSHTKLSPASTVDVVQFARTCHRKPFLSLLLHVALHCLHTRPTSFHFSLHAERQNDLRENISEIVGGREHLFPWHGIE